MADFADDLLAYLKADTNLSVLVGERVYVDMIRQGASLPCVMITEAQGGQYLEQLDKVAGLGQAAWHIYSYGATRTSANEVGEAVRKALHMMSGTMGSSQVDAVSCPVFRDTSYDQAKDKDYTPRYYLRQVYEIWHSIAEII